MFAVLRQITFFSDMVQFWHSSSIFLHIISGRAVDSGLEESDDYMQQEWSRAYMHVCSGIGIGRSRIGVRSCCFFCIASPCMGCGVSWAGRLTRSLVLLDSFCGPGEVGNGMGMRWRGDFGSIGIDMQIMLFIVYDTHYTAPALCHGIVCRSQCISPSTPLDH